MHCQFVMKKGLIGVMLRIKYLQILREMFIIDLKQGKELMIPSELRTSDLPQSMRFYDPIINMLETGIDEETTYTYSLKRNIAIN